MSCLSDPLNHSASYGGVKREEALVAAKAAHTRAVDDGDDIDDANCKFIDAYTNSFRKTSNRDRLAIIKDNGITDLLIETLRETHVRFEKDEAAAVGAVIEFLTDHSPFYRNWPLRDHKHVISFGKDSGPLNVYALDMCKSFDQTVYLLDCIDKFGFLKAVETVLNTAFDKDGTYTHDNDLRLAVKQGKNQGLLSVHVDAFEDAVTCINLFRVYKRQPLNIRDIKCFAPLTDALQLK